MPPPKLYVFAISHFCEKSRWALDYLGIDYQLVHLAPGQNVELAASNNLDKTSLPILDTGTGVIQGSAEIIDWAETHSANGRSLATSGDPDLCREIEERLDSTAGIHVRRYYYSEALVDYPGTVKPIFTANLSWPRKIAINLAWGKICGIMTKRMDLGPEQRLESKAIVDQELAWLDRTLAVGRNYLAGDAFSRADIGAASLLAPLANPPQHPVYSGLNTPPLFSAETAAWDHRPSLGWVRKMYQLHR